MNSRKVFGMHIGFVHHIYLMDQCTLATLDQMMQFFSKQTHNICVLSMSNTVLLLTA